MKKDSPRTPKHEGPPEGFGLDQQKPHIVYPTADELRAFGERCNAMGEAIKSSRGFMGVAAIRCAIDLDYLSRIIDAYPVKNIGQWQLVIKATVPGRKKGGDARAAKLSPQRRKEIAKKAARARWKK